MKTQTKIIILLATILVAIAYTKAVQHFAYKAGADSVQSKWDEENGRRDLETERIKAKNLQLSQENKDLSAQITTSLENANAKHAKALAAVRAEFDARMRKSETRAGIYREQAEGGTAECQRLASHAAELDRSLEQGRSLVEELRTTLGLRDEQLRQLGEQIRADRALLN